MEWMLPLAAALVLILLPAHSADAENAPTPRVVQTTDPPGARKR